MRCGGPAATSSSGSTREARWSRTRSRLACRLADPAAAVFLPLLPPPGSGRAVAAVTGDGTAYCSSPGGSNCPAPLRAVVAMWWLDQYAGGLCRCGQHRQHQLRRRGVPPAAKGADLGGGDGALWWTDFLYTHVPVQQFLAVPLAPRRSTIRRGAPGAALITRFGSVLEGAGIGGNIDGVPGERRERHDLQRPLMG